jgi:hypothetical protein
MRLLEISETTPLSVFIIKFAITAKVCVGYLC